ncbi:MAG: Rne/Rng family ribonuclease [candidate division Zixibacteria bacterium]|nr:Rne/Rng family ribonuclease [candidate division Zixibacteria bacterium]
MAKKTFMKKEIVISCSEYETRAAIIEDNKLVELYVERPQWQRLVGNIYKGKIKTVLPGMQASFIDIGQEKAAFLHGSDMGNVTAHERYESELLDDEEAPADIVRKGRREGIETVLEEGQDVLIQITKEPISTKGPRVTTEISIPGRFLVLVPDDDHVRVSKRISNWNEKKRLKKIVHPLRPEGFGLIVRTEAEGKDEKDIRSDIKRLLKLWTRLRKRAETMPAPALIHKEAEITTSIIRDIFTDDVERLLVDDRTEYRTIMAYVRQVMPHLKDRVELYKGDQQLFDLYKLESEIEKMLDRKVWIKKGSYLIIDQTEAMVTIDINTGRFVGKGDQETTIFRTNMEAARETARQIRLRDLGGLIVCDFIDMYKFENRRKLYEEFKRAFQKDRAKRAINPVNEFGLLEMTRERIRPSITMTFSEPCPHCHGAGRILSRETVATKIERWFNRAKTDGQFKKYDLALNPHLADSMMSNGVNRVNKIMKVHKIKINVIRDTTIPVQEFKVYNSSTTDDLTDEYKA